jgi:hypothetical protein
MAKRLFSRSVLASLIAITLVTPNSAAATAQCNPIKAKGKTVGQIAAGSVSMPIKSFNYPEGGVMEPQKTTLAAAVSLRHQPLKSPLGTSVIVWHVNYGGCNNPLNILTAQSAGYEFKVMDENGNTKKYVISKRSKVKKGDYKESWFDLIGPRKLLLVTCGGAFKNGQYEDNVVIIATPA